MSTPKSIKEQLLALIAEGNNITGYDDTDITTVIGRLIVGYNVGSGGINTFDATATAADIAKGKTAYAKGIKLVGTLLIPLLGILLENKANVEAYKTYTLIPSFTPSNASNQNIIWSSSNEDVATVENGVVSWVNGGECVISAITEEGSYKAECAISCETVTLNISETDIFVNANSTYQLEAALSTSNAPGMEFIWSSSNEDVATVSNGLVSWVNYGQCIITVTTADGKYSASCNVGCEAIATDIMSQFKYLGPTTYSPGTYTAWCPTGLIYDETRDVYAQFMNVQNTHSKAPNACELWFNTIHPETLEHSKPIFIARTAETLTANMVSSGALGCCIKDGVYYMFSVAARGYYKSVDGGATWTHEQYEKGPDNNPWGCYVLDNGRMIMGADTNCHKVYYSDDNGKNWTTVQSEHFNEPTFIDFGNGTVMAICRENWDANKNYQPPWKHVSYDYGATWDASVAMTSVGLMGNNNCNAYVHDNYCELFVGCRYHDNSPQYTGISYEIRQYVLDLSKGAVDEFEYVNTVYSFNKDGDNPQGLTNWNGVPSADDFSTPVIAIKDKSHALMTFYGPIKNCVTHHLIAVGNIPVDNYEIPSIIPTSYNASQVFSGVADDATITVCETYKAAIEGGYPSISAGYLKFNDIEDGGFVHIRMLCHGFGDATNLLYNFAPFISVKDMAVLSASTAAGFYSPLPNGTTKLPTGTIYGYSRTNNYVRGEPLDSYAFIDNNYWWIYMDGTWTRADSGCYDITNTTTDDYTNSPWNYPNIKEGLTEYKAFISPNGNWRLIGAIEYDKKLD